MGRKTLFVSFLLVLVTAPGQGTGGWRAALTCPRIAARLLHGCGLEPGVESVSILEHLEAIALGCRTSLDVCLVFETTSVVTLPSRRWPAPDGRV